MSEALLVGAAGGALASPGVAMAALGSAEPVVVVPDFRPRDRLLVLPVLAFFLANPDEELSVADMVAKFSIPTGKSMYASSALAGLRNMGLLAGRRDGRCSLWSAGPALAGWGASANGALCLQALRSGQKVAWREREPGAGPKPAAVLSAGQGAAGPVRAAAPVGALEIRLTLRVHGAGTPFQRVEVAGVEL